MNGIKKTKAVIQSAYNNNLIRAVIGLKVEEIELPPILSDEVLIRMEAAPCNPSDIAFLRGGYNIVKPLPAIPGFEGSGIVVEAGMKGNDLVGKRVCCFTQEANSGTWAEHFIAKTNDCILLKDDMDFEQAACFSINPLTAYGLFEIIRDLKCKTIIQNAAGGQVAKFIHVLANRIGVEVINIVRKEEHIKELQNKGAKYVLNSTDEHFRQKLTKLSNELNAQIALDAAGGEDTGLLINALQNDSKLIVYGGLSGAEISGINPMGIIFNGKSLAGFNLNEWIDRKSKEEFKKITDEMQDMFISGEMKTDIQDRFQLEDIVKGIRTYIQSMSAGKILFKP